MSDLNLFSKLKEMAIWQNFEHRRNMQLRYLSRAAQLDEASNPLLVQMALLSASGCVFLFLIWAALAKVDEVTRAPGEIVPYGFSQTVQHQEGGTVAEIMVTEGEVVEEGQALLRLSAGGLREDMNRLTEKALTLSLQRERLQAFIAKRKPDFSTFNLSPKKLLEQQQTFDSMSSARHGDREVLQRQISQKQQDISILTSKLKTISSRVKIQQELYDRWNQIYKKGYLSRVKLLDAKEKLVYAKGEMEEAAKEVSQSRNKLKEFQDRFSSMSATQKDQAYQQLEEVTADLGQTQQAIAKLQNQLGRLVVRAPVRGVIKGLSVNTVGGVVAPGQVLMEIVPLDKPLMVELRIPPQSIAHLHSGQPVQLKVSAYDFSRYGALDGQLDFLSATTFLGDGGQRYYKGRVHLRRNSFGFDGQNSVAPGMTVMADIITGKKSILAYLFKPIQVSLMSAFQEK